MATKKTKKAPAKKPVKKAAAKKTVKKQLVKKTIAKKTVKKAVAKKLVKKAAAKKTTKVKTAKKAANSKLAPSCNVPGTYLLGPMIGLQRGYHVKYDRFTRSFELRYYENGPTGTIQCIVNLIDDQYLRIKVTKDTTNNRYSINFSRTNPSGSGTTKKSVQGNGTNIPSLAFVRNTYWHVDVQLANPIYKIVGADDERNLTKPDNELNSNLNLLYANSENGYVYIKYVTGAYPQYDVVMQNANPTNIDSQLHDANPKPSQIFKQRNDNQ